MTRLLGTGAGIIFKGSGFYETDYKKNAGEGKDKGDAGTSADGKPENKVETKSDSKGETKPVKPAAEKTKTKAKKKE